MTASAMRTELMAYLADADEKKIMGLYNLLEEAIKEKNSSALTTEQLAFLNNERKKHLSGESKSYNWQEVKEMIRQKKAS